MRLTTTVTLALVAAIFSPTLPARSATIRVPDDQPSIQAGLDAAAAGDTVLVSAGVYYERVTLDADDDGVTLMSAVGPDSTFIDGQGSDGQSLVTIQDCGSATMIAGFTLNGTGLTEYHDGGGVSCLASSPTIVGVVVRDCVVYTFGGGIFLQDSDARVLSSTVTGCTAGMGGGVYTEDGTPEIDGNRIEGNTARSFVVNLGGGLYACRGEPVITNNVFVGNESWSGGGGIFIECDTGGTVSSNVITDNTASDGGGVGVEGCRTSFDGNVIVGNTAYSWGGAVAWRGLPGREPAFTHNIIFGNSDEYGAIKLGGESFPVFTGNSLGGNYPREVWIRATAVAGTVDMKENWWGVADPSAHPDLIWDCVDDAGVAACVDFSDWCTDPSCGGQVTSVPDASEPHPSSWGRIKSIYR